MDTYHDNIYMIQSSVPYFTTVLPYQWIAAMIMWSIMIDIPV